jgi:hypothetical protein
MFNPLQYSGLDVVCFYKMMIEVSGINNVESNTGLKDDRLSETTIPEF